jgi:hypothetical protein
MRSLASAGWAIQFAFAMQIVTIVLATFVTIFTAISLIRLFNQKAPAPGPTRYEESTLASDGLYRRRSLVANNVMVLVGSAFSLVRSANQAALFILELEDPTLFPYSITKWETNVKLSCVVAWFTYAMFFLFFTSLLAVERRFYESQNSNTKRICINLGYGFLVLVLLALFLTTFGLAVSQYGCLLVPPIAGFRVVDHGL